MLRCEENLSGDILGVVCEKAAEEGRWDIVKKVRSKGVDFDLSDKVRKGTCLKVLWGCDSRNVIARLQELGYEMLEVSSKGEVILEVAKNNWWDAVFELVENLEKNILPVKFCVPLVLSAARAKEWGLVDQILRHQLRNKDKNSADFEMIPLACGTVVAAAHAERKNWVVDGAFRMRLLRSFDVEFIQRVSKTASRKVARVIMKLKEASDRSESSGDESDE